MVVAVGWSWSVMVVVVGLRLMIDQGVGRLASKSALNGSKVLSFFVLDFWGVNWDSVNWCWGISVDWSFVVMVESSFGFSVGGEVSVFSGNNFWSLWDGKRSSMVTVSWKSPVRDNWSVDSVNSVDHWCGVMVRRNSVNWSWSLWQVGGWDDLESVVWVGDVFHWLDMSMSINIRVSSVEMSVMWFGFLFRAQRIAVKENTCVEEVWQLNRWIDCLPVAVAITAMSILSLELGGNCSIRNGCAWSDEQCCNYLSLVRGEKDKKIELTRAK